MEKNFFALRMRAVESFLGSGGKLAKLGRSASDALILVCQDGIGWEDIYYFTGFVGSSSVLLISPDDAVLFVDPRYERQARETDLCRVVSCAEVRRSSPLNAAVGYISANDMRRVAYNGRNIPNQSYRYIERALGEQAELTDLTYLLSNLRRRKSGSEVTCIREAIRIASGAFDEAVSGARPGMMEREFAGRLECLMKSSGSDFAYPLPVMVSSGERTSMPHAMPTDKKFERGDIIMVDFGARFAGYVCDLTRMISVGTPTEEIKSLHSILQWAQTEAAALIVPGAATSEVDSAARTVLAGASLGSAFVHGVGHGIGLAVHETPSLGESSSAILAEGDVITLEPAFYRPGWGGMRVEDDYLVTDCGFERLSESFPNGLRII